MLELLFLLLPIAAGYGWFMGRNSVKQNAQSATESLSIKYSTGLNYLLSNQQDKAIEFLLETLSLEDDTVEAHFAMANLFRKRGELDRALKVHEHLVRQKYLSDDERQQAVYELGKDFHSAGLYDRAEEMFLRLQKTTNYGPRAISFLMHIYQHTKDWQKGIELENVIKATQDKKLLHVLANFYCQLAVIARNDDNFIAVFELLENALASDPNSSRANWMRAQVFESNKQYAQACQCYRDIYIKDQEFFPDVIPAMAQCYDKLDAKQEFYKFIEKVYQETHSTSALIKLLEHIEQEQGYEKANEFILLSLKRRPTIRGFDYFVAMQKSKQQKNEGLDVIKELIAAYLKVRPRYRCRSCGFNSSIHYWSCPSCHDWEQLKPVRGLEGE